MDKDLKALENRLNMKLSNSIEKLGIVSFFFRELFFILDTEEIGEKD